MTKVMLACVCILFFVALISLSEGASCSGPAAILEITPGAGWDNLRNLDRRQVFAQNYTQCTLTEDGMFLIPDYVTATFYPAAKANITIELLETLDNFTGSFTRSINEDTSFGVELRFLNGKYSRELMSYKSRMVFRKTVVYRGKVMLLKYNVPSTGCVFVLYSAFYLPFC